MQKRFLQKNKIYLLVIIVTIVSSFGILSVDPLFETAKAQLELRARRIFPPNVIIEDDPATLYVPYKFNEDVLMSMGILTNDDEGPSVIPPGEWVLPIREFTVLSSNASDHISRGSVPAWDLTAPCGTSIYPVKEGTVSVVGVNPDGSCNNAGNYGCFVYITHEDGWVSRYAHMLPGSIVVTEGQKVDKGTKLGQIGCTGYTEFGPHVHLEILHGTQVDPASIFGDPATIGLPYKPFCYYLGCPSGIHPDFPTCTANPDEDPGSCFSP
jgi:hypothetical protein